MSQQRVWTVPKITTVRYLDDGSSGQGAGALPTMVVGRNGSSGTRRNHKTFLRPTTNWAGVKTIRSVILTVTTADTYTGDAVPTVIFRRLTDGFTEGSAAGYDSGDYTTAGSTTSGQITVRMSKVDGGQTDIDITAFAKKYAPSSVSGGSGTTAQADARNFGIGLYASSDPDEDWTGYSDNADVPGNRPFVTITYEEGATVPNTPTNISPVGTVDSISAFEMDFTDSRATDTLAVSEVDFYNNGSEKTGDADLDNTIDVTSHGYAVGDMVRFTSLTGGTGLSLGTLYYVRTRVNANSFTVSTTAGGTTVNITDAYSEVKCRKVIWHATKNASETEKVTDHSFVLPAGLHPTRGIAYQWRGRQKDQEGQWSPWTAFTTVTALNADPDAPTSLTPDADGTPPSDDFDSLLGVWFRSTAFSDGDDTMSAFQDQMSALVPADPSWDDASFIKWDTGKRYVGAGVDIPESQYGGVPLVAGDYYWRRRWWDNHDGLSDWTYARITLTTDFDPEPGDPTGASAVQTNPHAPWRIRIREMKYNSMASRTGAITGVAATNLLTSAKNHSLTRSRRVRFSSITGGTGLFVGRDYWVISSGLGDKTFRVSETQDGTQVDFTTAVTAAVLTAVTTRGPGNVIAVIDNAKSVGASIVYNSPGEAHFTLPVNHPQISVIEPKQVHYGIDFYTGDGWRETFAGLVDDLDANEKDAVFPCVDYLGLYDRVSDERYYPNDPDRSYTLGGSKYTNKSISTIVTDQLTRAQKLADSPVGFISIGTIASMTDLVTIWSTMQPVLGFIGGLLDSHRQGLVSGSSVKKTRIKVRRTSAGGYEVVVEDAPGQVRDNLRLRYGEMVNGYRVVVFGTNWASLLHTVGRTREGIRVLYKTVGAPGVDRRIWGRFARAVIVDNVSDERDLLRRTRQMAIKAGKFGQGIALAIRSGVLRPRDGYDVTDDFPVVINHGVVNTDNYGSTYYTCWAIAWEASDDGHSDVVLTLTPREDTAAASSGLIDSSPISPQKEWQVIPSGLPDPAVHTAAQVLSQSSGIKYTRTNDEASAQSITGTA